MSVDTESINPNKYTLYFDKILDEEVRLLKSIISFLESDLLKEITNVTPVQERLNLFNKLLRACAKKDNSLANIISAINNNLPMDSEKLKKDIEDSSANFEETISYINKFSNDLGFPTDFLKSSFIGELFSNLQDNDTEDISKDFIDIENLNICEEDSLEENPTTEENTLKNKEVTNHAPYEIDDTNSIETFEEPSNIVASNEYVEPFEAKDPKDSFSNYAEKAPMEDTASNYYNTDYYNYKDLEDSKDSYDY